MYIALIIRNSISHRSLLIVSELSKAPSSERCTDRSSYKCVTYTYLKLSIRKQMNLHDNSHAHGQLDSIKLSAQFGKKEGKEKQELNNTNYKL